MNQPHQPRHLLIVDDDPACRESLMEFFVREGFQVAIASRGDEAFEVLRRQQVDLSVMDVHMPGLSGPEVLQRLRRVQGVQVPPTVLTSSDRSAEALVRTLLGLRVEFVPKPIRLDAMRRSVQELLRDS